MVWNTGYRSKAFYYHTAPEQNYSVIRKPGGHFHSWITGSATELGATHSKNYATGFPYLTKIMQKGIAIDEKIVQQGIMWKEAFLSSPETVDHIFFGKLLCNLANF